MENMPKKTYYVAVSHGEIMQDKSAFDYEFEIQATDDELNKLQELFEDTAETETHNSGWSMKPFSTLSNDEMNAEYDANLMELYQMIYSLGTDETKTHIESMHILH